MSSPNEEKAVLRGSVPPSEEHRRRLLKFLEQTYHRSFALEWVQDDSLAGGFVLQVGTDLYDWSVEGRLRQFKERLEQLRPAHDEVIPLIREAVEKLVARGIARGAGAGADGGRRDCHSLRP